MKHDEAKSTFDRPYCGPFKVLHKHDKYFTLDLGTRMDNVAIHRLKAAHFLEHDINDKPSSTTRPTPHVHYPRPSTPLPLTSLRSHMTNSRRPYYEHELDELYTDSKDMSSLSYPHINTSQEHAHTVHLLLLLLMF